METPNFTHIKELLLKHQYLVIGIICAVFFYIVYSIDVSSASKQLKLAKQHEEDLKQQFQSLHNMEVALNYDAAHLPQLQATLNGWKAKLVVPAALPDLQNEILKMGTANNLQFILFTPGGEIRDGEYLKTPIKAVVSGNYNDIAHFISQIANMQAIIAIKDFVIFRKTSTAKNLSAVNENHLFAEFNFEVFYAANK